MPEPHLLPDAADLAKLGYITIVAALTTGMGFLVGARRLDTAFFAGWGLASLIFVTAGTWLSADLGLAAAAAGLLGFAGLIRQAGRFSGSRATGDRVGWRVLCIGLPFIVLVLGMTDIAWDDFSFWVPNLLHLSETRHFPTLAQPAAYSNMAAYPYGVALPGFAVHLLGGHAVDTVAFVWNLLAMLAACAAFADVLASRLRATGHVLAPGALWGLVAAAVLVVGMGNPTFIAKNLLTNMGDGASGAGLAVLCGLLFDWVAQPTNSTQRTRILLEVALTCCAIVFIRQANPALLGLLLLSAVAGLAVFRDRFDTAEVAGLLVALIPAMFIWYSWTRYADMEIPQGRHYLLPWQDWHWSVFGSTLRAALHVLVSKSGFTIMAAGIGGTAAYLILRRMRGGGLPEDGRAGVASAVIVTAVAGLTFGNIAFLLFCYLGSSFAIDEAAHAITFWRFISQTGEAMMVGFACIIPVRWLIVWLSRSWLQRLLPAIALVLPVAAFPAYRDDLTSPVPRLRAVADDLHRTVPVGDPLVLLELSGNGFAPLVVKYQMTAVDDDQRPLAIIADPEGITPDRARALRLPTAGYIWLAAGSPAYGEMFGGLTDTACSYLFSRGVDGFRPIETWEIGRYRWEIQAYADAPTPPPSEGLAHQPLKC
jgi:hypothetical protein